MKKFILLIVLLAVGIASCQAKTSYEYVKYPGGLELIVKTETHLLYADTKTYGLRKHGMEIIPPEYQSNKAFIVEELSLLFFLRRDAHEVRVYNIKTGAEVVNMKAPERNGWLKYYELKKEVVDGELQWQIVESYQPSGSSEEIKTVVLRFVLQNGKACQLINPKVTYTRKEL